MYINAGNAAYSVSTAFTRLNEIKFGFFYDEKTIHIGSPISPPIFFMNIITSDSLKFPFASVPIVSCKLPYTCGTAKETKSPSREETDAASWSIF